MYVILYAMYVILYVMYVCSGRLACFYLILFLVKRIEHFNHLDMRYINVLYYYYYYYYLSRMTTIVGEQVNPLLCLQVSDDPIGMQVTSVLCDTTDYRLDKGQFLIANCRYGIMLTRMQIKQLNQYLNILIP